MGRFSPTVQPTPSWTNSLATATGDIGNAMMQRRRMQQMQDQADLENAQHGIFRGNAPTSIAMPDFQIGTTQGGDPTATPSPQMIQSARPYQAPMSAQMGGTVDPNRYSQIQTKSGSPYYEDATKTPFAEQMKLRETSAQEQYYRTMNVQELRNAGAQQKTQMNIDASDVNGARTRGKLAQINAQGDNSEAHDTRLYGDPNDPSTPGRKVVSQNQIEQFRDQHRPVSQGRGTSSANPNAIMPSDPQRVAFSTITHQQSSAEKQMSDAQKDLNSTDGLMESAAMSKAAAHPELPPPQTPIHDRIAQLRQKIGQLSNSSDSLSTLIQGRGRSSTAPHVTTDGNEATAQQKPAPGAQTQTITTPGGRVDADQHTAPKTSMAPSPIESPDAKRARLGQQYGQHLQAMHARTDLTPADKAQKELELQQIYQNSVGAP